MICWDTRKSEQKSMEFVLNDSKRRTILIKVKRNKTKQKVKESEKKGEKPKREHNHKRMEFVWLHVLNWKTSSADGFTVNITATM